MVPAWSRQLSAPARTGADDVGLPGGGEVEVARPEEPDRGPDPVEDAHLEGAERHEHVARRGGRKGGQGAGADAVILLGLGDVVVDCYRMAALRQRPARQDQRRSGAADALGLVGARAEQAGGRVIKHDVGHGAVPGIASCHSSRMDSTPGTGRSRPDPAPHRAIPGSPRSPVGPSQPARSPP